MELNLDREESKDNLSESTGFVRIYRYPHHLCDLETVWGMEVHTDSSVLSILLQDEAIGGLQVLNDNQWFSVQPTPNTLIVNLGDMMQVCISLIFFPLVLLKSTNEYN